MSYTCIIPSRNETNLRACVSAIRAAGETCRIIVVWDGDHYQPLPDWFDDTSLLPFTVAGGWQPFIFARNVNIGIRAAGEDDVILLNDDALLKTPYGFSRSAIALDARPDIGILSPVTNNIGNPLQVGKLQNMSGPIKNEPRTLAFVCVFIPRSTIDTVGLLDEDFINYGVEDDDYCLRVRQAGLKLGVYDGCFLDHQRLPSEFGSQGRRDYRANMAVFIRKHGVDNWNRPRGVSPFSDLWPKEGE